MGCDGDRRPCCVKVIASNKGYIRILAKDNLKHNHQLLSLSRVLSIIIAIPLTHTITQIVLFFMMSYTLQYVFFHIYRRYGPL